MKITNPRTHRAPGFALVIVVVAVLVISIAIASFLQLTSAQNLNSIRSQTWNSALPLAEAALEEAIEHLNYNHSNLSTDGWIDNGDVYLKQHFLSQGSFEVTISKDADPIIRVIGFAALPPSLSPQGGPDHIARTIKAVATLSGEEPGAFCHGLVALEDINMNGNSVRTDSFDSTDPNHSTTGGYDPAKFKDGGDVATNSGLANSINVGNANIYGNASTGPNGSFAIGPNGAVGSIAWHAAGNSGVQSGWFSDDMNVQFPDVEVPWTGGASTPSGGSYSGENYEYIFGSGTWELSGISMGGSKKAIITGDAKVYVTNNINLSGNAEIIIEPGANLELYVGGSASLGGNGVINENASASSFYYFGLPGNTTLSISGNASFTGVIYAPDADLTMNGGGFNNYDFVGASVSKSVNMNGNVNFHYDESLCENGPPRGSMITWWEEVASQK